MTQDPEAGRVDDERDPRPGRRGFVAMVVILTILAGAVIAWWLTRDTDAPPPDLWAETSHPYDPDCSEECPEILAPRPLGHGSRDGMTFSMRTDPRIDDAVAQWGACMDSVFTCVDTEPPAAESERADHLRQCVAQSTCPDRCKTRFADSSGQSLDDAATAFQELFLEDNAWCLPRL